MCVLQVASFRRSGTAIGFNRGSRGWWLWTGPWWPARAAASRPKTTSSSFRTRESLSRLNCKWDIVCLVCLCVCTRVYERLARYRQAAVDMKRCTDRISRPFIRVSPRHHPRPSATELLLINCTLRWPDPPTKRSRRRANRQHGIKRFSGEIPRRKGSRLTGRGWSKNSRVSRYYDGC